MTPAASYCARLLSIGIALLVMALLGCLSGCGGGDEPPAEPDQPTPGVDCAAKPELCK